MNPINDWKTTLVGLIIVLVGVGQMIQAGHVDAASIGTMTAGVGLILAADSKK